MAQGSSDPDGQPLTFAWTLISKPATSMRDPQQSHLPAAQLTIDVVGDYTVQLVVTMAGEQSPIR